MLALRALVFTSVGVAAFITALLRGSLAQVFCGFWAGLELFGDSWVLDSCLNHALVWY